MTLNQLSPSGQRCQLIIVNSQVISKSSRVTFKDSYWTLLESLETPSSEMPGAAFLLCPVVTSSLWVSSSGTDWLGKNTNPPSRLHDLDSSHTAGQGRVPHLHRPPCVLSQSLTLEEMLGQLFSFHSVITVVYDQKRKKNTSYILPRLLFWGPSVKNPALPVRKKSIL